MELTLRDVDTAVEDVIEVGLDATVDDIVTKAAHLFQRDPGLCAVILNDVPLALGERLADLGVEGGSCLEIHTDLQGIVGALRRGSISLQIQKDWVRDNSECVFSAVQHKGAQLRDASNRLKADVDIVLSAFRQSAHALRHAHPTTWQDNRFLTEVLQDASNIEYAPAGLKEDAHFLLRCVQANGLTFIFLADSWRNDVTLASAAADSLEGAQGSVVKDVLRSAGSRVRSDAECAKRFLAKCGSCLQLLDPSLQDDESLVLQAVAQNGNVFCRASQRLRGSPSFVEEAAALSSAIFIHVLPSVYEDTAMSRRVLLNNARALSFMDHPSVRDSAELIRLAILSIDDGAWLMSYASDALKDNPTFFATFSDTIQAAAFRHMSFSLRSDETLVKKCVSIDTSGFVLRDCNDAFKDRDDIVHSSILQNYDTLRYASDRLKRDIPFLSASCLHISRYSALRYADDTVKDNLTFMTSVIKRFPGAYSHASDTLKDNKDIALICVKERGYGLSFVSPAMRCNPEVVEAAVLCDARYLRDADAVLRDDIPFILRLVKQCGAAYRYAGEPPQQSYEVIQNALQNDVSILSEVLRIYHPDDTFYREHLSLKYGNESTNDLSLIRQSLHHMTSDTTSLKWIGESIKDDLAFATEMVQCEGANLQYFNERIRGDKRLAEGAVKEDYKNFAYAGRGLRTAEFLYDVVMSEVEANVIPESVRSGYLDEFELRGGVNSAAPCILAETILIEQIFASTLPQQEKIAFLTSRPAAIKEVIATTAFITQYCIPLSAFHPITSVLDNFDFMLSIVTANGSQIQYGSKRIRQNRTIQLAAVISEGKALQYIEQDHRIVMAAVQADGMALRYVSALRTDGAVVEAAVQQNGNAVEFVKNCTKSVALLAVQGKGEALRHLEEWCDDKDVVIAAVRQDGTLLRRASERLRCDHETVRAAIVEGGVSYEECGADVTVAKRIVYQQFAISAVSKFPGVAAVGVLSWGVLRWLPSIRQMV